MTTLAAAHIASTAPADAFFERWADMATWPEWNLDTEWVRLDGPFAEGSGGTLKPKGGPKVRFTIARLVPGREFVDVSHLVGAKLTFSHVVDVEDGRTSIAVTVTLTGPLARVWRLILGKGIAASVQPDLDRLGDLVAAAQTRAGTTVSEASRE